MTDCKLSELADDKVAGWIVSVWPWLMLTMWPSAVGRTERSEFRRWYYYSRGATAFISLGLQSEVTVPAPTLVP